MLISVRYMYTYLYISSHFYQIIQSTRKSFDCTGGFDFRLNDSLSIVFTDGKVRVATFRITPIHGFYGFQVFKTKYMYLLTFI